MRSCAWLTTYLGIYLSNDRVKGTNIYASRNSCTFPDHSLAGGWSGLCEFLAEHFLAWNHESV